MRIKILLVLLACLIVLDITAQNASAALDGKMQTPQERYLLMKTNSQTYQDYKVIKEHILDAVWKIAVDSLTKRNTQLTEANTKIISLQNDVKSIQAQLKSKEDSMAEIVFASTHISVLGSGITKKAFLIGVACSLVALVGVIILLLMNLNNMQSFVSESNLIVTNITHEFDEFKRNAVEKQIKLSRDLQTERNKVMELKELHKA